MKNFLLTSAITLSILLLQACGGGGGGSQETFYPSYTGLTTEARIDTANAEDLSMAAASGTQQAVAAGMAGGAFTPRVAVNLEGKLVEISPKIAKWAAQSGVLYSAKITTDASYICDMGGSATSVTNDTGTVGTITFSSCGISDGAGGAMYLTGIVDFTVTLVGNTPDAMTMVFHVTASSGGESANIDLTLSCVNMTGVASCTVSSDFAGLDNRIYRVTDISVTGDDTSGYYINATVYDPDHGRVSLTTTAPLFFGCANGVPSTGTVVISGSDSTSASISFDSCTAYTVTIDAVAYYFTW